MRPPRIAVWNIEIIRSLSTEDNVNSRGPSNSRDDDQLVANGGHRVFRRIVDVAA